MACPLKPVFDLSPADPTVNNFVCGACQKTFSEKRNLRKHENNTHGRTANGFKCVLCSELITNQDNYVYHLKIHHDIQIELTNLRFTSRQEFDEWKRQMEDETSSYYTISSSNPNRKYYDCNRSGTLEPQPVRSRHMKIQGSRKIGGRCPSRIKVELIDGNINVLFYKTHIGHQIELKHINLPRANREELAAYLSIGMSRCAILNKIRMTWSKETVNRVHLTSQKDLQNITKSFNLKANVNRNANDLVSVESWIAEMRSSEQDPIILYQEPAEDGSSSFVLGISTIGQRYLLEKHGENIIAIDSTHGTNDYDFQLTTIMVVDENRTGFPVAYLYSSKVDTETCVTFFSAVKSVCNIKTPKVFMSDDFNGYYNAWCITIGPPEHHLLCTWHVLEQTHFNYSMSRNKKRTQKRFISRSSTA
ncbi:uncharacterized protein LOC107371466 [Tetranychus urticae]|uniref:uncharacterized protein LOC107371466 n=1 Tax=Tetranychus urticae TaxID=32264 RepID=UPI00077BB13D|nr:uncharacterized protein LOC107371466 [Tetranychus urticae]